LKRTAMHRNITWLKALSMRVGPAVYDSSIFVESILVAEYTLKQRPAFVYDCNKFKPEQLLCDCV
jgi:hypothetical protein